MSGSGSASARQRSGTRATSGRRSPADRSLPGLVTRAEWERLPARSRGYVAYWQGGVRGSQIAGVGNPFAPGSREYGEYAAGEAQAVLDAQDSEE